MPTNQLIFLHGLHSSPASTKCLALRDFLARRNTEAQVTIALHAPQLAYDPSQNFVSLPALLESVLGQHDAEHVALVGSSMGGYYAGCLAQRYGMRAVLINPVVNPVALMHRVTGQQLHPVTGEVYDFGLADNAKFAQWGALDQLNEERVLLCLGLRDQTLDPVLARSHFPNCARIEDPTGDHRFPRFVTALPEILSFLFPSL